MAYLRASDRIANLEAEVERLTRINKVLSARLGAEEAEFLDEVPERYGAWADGLSPQQTALMALLRKRYPAPVSKLDLLEALPGYDHVEDRQPKQVAVVVAHVRQKLGKEIIENIQGFGYGLSQAGAEFVDADRKHLRPRRDA